MISTGSMAPTLLGYHQQITCPTCKFHFPHGVAFDDDYSSLSAANGEGDSAPDFRTVPETPLLTCPHCSQTAIDASRVPRTEGDQLLVNKLAYTFRDPARWEVAVFRNPANPLQAYVKRVGGLPGETIQIRNGDLYADGRLARKPYQKQLGVRILVFDQALSPRSDPEWKPRWVQANPGSFEQTKTGFRVASDSSTEWSWLRYRHWIRSGGRHRTVVPLDQLPLTDLLTSLVVEDEDDPRSNSIDDSDSPDLSSRSDYAESCPVRYESTLGSLTCTGVLSDVWLRRLQAESTDPRWQSALETLAARSHDALIMDDYGYNDWQGFDKPHPVRDLMLSLELNDIGNPVEPAVAGQFVIVMADGDSSYQVIFDIGRKRLFVRQDDQSRSLLSASLPVGFRSGRRKIDVSLFDRQLTVAIDGEVIGKPLLLPDDVGFTDGDVPRAPVAFGVRNLKFEIAGLQLYRDVYYTRGRAKNGIDKPYTLGDDEFFMLGDNSPVSSDSRSWDNGAVPRFHLVGKPFVVHLPSQPAQMKVNGSRSRFRLPDPSRIRYIR